MPTLPQPLLLLERENRHERDARIRFDEEAHVYYVDGVRFPTSVSGVVHEHFPHFDATATVDKYYERWKDDKQSKYNPLINYLVGVVGLDDDTVKDQISNLWSSSGKQASAAGTNTHFQIEMCLNEEEHVKDTPEFQQFLRWKDTHPTWIPYRAEWSIFAEKELLCGQIDSIWKDTTDGKLHMADWKRVVELKMTGFRNEKGYEPFDNMQNTNYFHYVVQQNCYAWILKTYYNTEVSSLALVQVHPSIDDFIEWPLPFVYDKIDIVMERRRQRVEAGVLKTIAPSEVAASKRCNKEDEEVVQKRKKFKSDLQRFVDSLPSE